MSPVIAVTSLDDVIDVLGGCNDNSDDLLVSNQETITRLRRRIEITAELLDIYARSQRLISPTAYEDLRDALLFDSPSSARLFDSE